MEKQLDEVGRPHWHWPKIVSACVRMSMSVVASRLSWRNLCACKRRVGQGHELSSRRALQVPTRDTLIDLSSRRDRVAETRPREAAR